MNDVWFGPDLTLDDHHAFLTGLALDPRGGLPVLAVDSGAAGPAGLVMASAAFFDLFSARDSQALAERLLGGRDPGSRRLVELAGSLPLGGTPRLERLRFLIGSNSELVTCLCRRMRLASGRLVFVAAALGVRPGLMPSATVPVDADAEPSRDRATSPTEGASFDAPMNVPAIYAALAARWPSSRRVRFVWQSDADGICRQISPPLGAIVGEPNSDLVGRSLLELAPWLDSSGKLAAALAGRGTWSGVEVAWPIADAPGAIVVGLGAIPIHDADRAFAGFSGYGVVHLDRVVACQPTRLVPSPKASRERANVVPFPNGQKSFTAEDQATFVALGAELRDRAGLAAQDEETALGPAGPGEARTVRGREANDRLAVLDRVAVGLLISRDYVPVFANRYFLDTLGFADEDALHAAGGLTYLFGAGASVATGEAVGLRGHDGAVVPSSTRLHKIVWDGLPATLLVVQPTPRPDTSASHDAEQDAAIEAMAREHAEDRRRDESELRNLRAILETAADGVAVVDAAGDVVSLNRSGEALFGRDRGAVIGRPFVELFAPENQRLVGDYLNGLTTDATRSLFNDGREILVKAPQGGTIPVFMTLGRLDTGEPPAIGESRFCALFRDLTHWKKVETELESAKRDAEASSAAKTDFLAKISHEVRTPLNAIIGFAEVILEERFGPVGSERYREYLRDIHTSGTHVMSLVNDLLDLSKIEAGRMELEPTAIDANKIITECVGLMQPQASRERVIMRLSLAPGLPMIRADERSLRQIVLNLLSNAVKFNEPGGQVIVATAAPEDGKVVIRVRDTGAGMSDADITTALEPFRQVATRPLSEGTGLGLPLTKALVEANEATFLIRSKVDHGTLIEVAFPPARVLAGHR